MTNQQKKHFMSNQISGAEAIIRSLLAENIETIFGYPGGAIIPVYDVLYGYTDRLRHILVRHEQGAVHAAQGFARVSGKIGVAIVTSGPGATNIITGVADALTDSTPLVVISGQVDSKVLGSDAFQETDVIGITQPVTKWSYQVRRAEDIPWAISRAFYIAASGRPGPVVIDVTKDAQTGMMEWDYEKCNFIRSYNPTPKINPEAVEQAAELINSAQRPLIIAGHGVMIAKAEKELVELAEKAEIPVINTLMGLSSIPTDHPLYKGMAGMHGNIAANVATNACDVLIAIGMRFDDRVTGDPNKYARQAKIVHIDIDRSEFNKNIPADVAIHGDARKVLEQLLPQITATSHKDWLATFERPQAVEDEKVIHPEIYPAEGPMNMGEVARKVSEATGNKAILVTDVGQNQMLSARYFKYTQPDSIVTSGGLGTMGFGLPAAIGAKIAAPEREVCLFVGDGGLQMTIQELGTILEFKVPVKIILLNNNFLGMVRQWQELFYHKHYSQTPMTNPDFSLICKAYGIEAEDVCTREELDGAIRRMVDCKGAYLLNVNIKPEGMVFPMTPAGSGIDTILVNSTERYN